MLEPTIHPDREKCSIPSDPSTVAKQVLTYKVIGDRQLTLWFHHPAQKIYEKTPVILIIPGGGWTECSIQDTHNIYAMEYDAIYNSGFATATIEYRTTYDQISMEELISDCMDAVRYLCYYQDILGIDPQNIITTGHSAGGHLSLMLAYAPHAQYDVDQYWFDAEDFRVVGCVALSPPPILYADSEGPYSGYYTNGPWNFNLSLWTHKNNQVTASPIEYVRSNGVPCRILMGTLDEYVAPESVSRFVTACKNASMPCEVVWFENGGHGFESRNGQPVSPNYDTERAKIVEFAKACVK